MTVKTSQLDLTNKKFKLAVQITGPSGVETTRSYGFFGKHAMIQINCSTSGSSDRTPQDATFDQVAQSFAFDPAEAYDSSFAAGFNAGKVLGQIGAFGIIALIVALVIKKARA